MRFSRVSFSDRFGIAARCGNWVHASIDAGTTNFKVHVQFIATSLALGCAAIAFAPAYLSLVENVSLVGGGLLCAAASPLLWGWIVSRTGQLGLAQKGMIVSLSATLTFLCLLTGGITSPFIFLLCVIPLEGCVRGENNLGFSFFCLLVAAAAVVACYWLVPISTVPPLAIFASIALSMAYAISFAIRVANWRHHSENQLKAERNRFRLMAENAGDLITCHDLDGSTFFASPAAQPLCGVKASGLLNAGFFEQIHLQDRVHFLKGLSVAFHDQQASTLQLRIRCKGSGNLVWKWVSTRIETEQYDFASKSAIVAVTSDISNNKNQETALQKAAERSEASHHAQRRFITTMSHELRTPLNAIIGFSDMLRQQLFGPLPDKRQAEYVDLIHDSGQHLLQVVNDMLDMSRIEAGRYELSVQPFHISEVAHATVKMLGSIASNGGVSVSNEVSSSLPELTADKRACQQILINLVSNAIKFTPKGGLVRISAKQHGRSIKLRVSDTGIGIEESFLASLGQPFMQADNGNNREFEGSGLGLSVVKGLVALHGGQFDVRSVKDAGTTVTVTLPLKASTCRPVPADGEAQLVRLNNDPSLSLTRAETEIKSQTTSENKGDHRARVSA